MNGLPPDPEGTPDLYDLKAPSRILIPTVTPLGTGWEKVPWTWHRRVWERLRRPLHCRAPYDLVKGPNYRPQLLRRTS